MSRYIPIANLAILLLAATPHWTLAGDMPVKPKQDEGKILEVTGTLRTGLMAIGGETTGTTISGDGKTYEVDFRESPKLADVAETLNGKTAVVKGKLQRRMGVERGERWIIMAADLKAADAKKEGAATSNELKFDTYSGYFVSNKFEPEAAETYLFITDQNQFDLVFGAAFVMGDKSHRLPKDAFESLMVVTAIKRGNAMWQYKVDGVSEKDGVVQLRYTATKGKPDTATFAVPLIVSVPKGDYKAIEFIENKKSVKKIEIEKK